MTDPIHINDGPVSTIPPSGRLCRREIFSLITSRHTTHPGVHFLLLYISQLSSESWYDSSANLLIHYTFLTLTYLSVRVFAGVNRSVEQKIESHDTSWRVFPFSYLLFISSVQPTNHGRPIPNVGQIYNVH